MPSITISKAIESKYLLFTLIVPMFFYLFLWVQYLLPSLKTPIRTEGVEVSPKHKLSCKTTLNCMKLTVYFLEFELEFLPNMFLLSQNVPEKVITH